MKVTLPLLAIFAGLAAAVISGDDTTSQVAKTKQINSRIIGNKDAELDTNAINTSPDVGGLDYCPTGRPCKSDRVRVCAKNHYNNKLTTG